MPKNKNPRSLENIMKDILIEGRKLLSRIANGRPEDAEVKAAVKKFNDYILSDQAREEDQETLIMELLQKLAEAPAPVATVPVLFTPSPTTSSSLGGDTINLTGNNLTGVTQVLFGDTPGTDLVVKNDTSLSVKAPALEAGDYDVTAINAAGASDAAPGTFSVF